MEDHFVKSELIPMIERPSMQLRDRALVAFLFMSAARISEVVQEIRKEQIKIKTIGGCAFMIIEGIPIEKRHVKAMRNIPVFIEKEKPFFDIFMMHFNRLRPGDFLFDISRVGAWYATKRVTGKNPHFLRHSRLTNLKEEYHYDVSELVAITGWADWRSAEPYVHLDYETTAKKMIRSLNS